MFDANIIKLEELIVGIDFSRIHEIWRVYTIDNKSVHFVILYDNSAHLCTCLTLINRGLVCQHFFAIMLVSEIAKFHIKLIPQRWYLNIFQNISIFENELAIILALDKELNTFEDAVQIDFSHLESIHGNHIF